MATNLAGGFCIAQAKLCYLRVGSLTTTCAPAVGANAGVVTDGIVTLTRSAEIEEGQEYQFKNGCGQIKAQSNDVDRLKWYNLTGEIFTMDYELMQIMFGGSLITADVGEDYAGKTIGYCRPSGSALATNGVSVELWVETVIGTGGGCSTDATAPQYVRHVFPRVTFIEGDRTFENDGARFTFDGKAYENPAWGNGPWNDYPGVYPACTDSAHFEFIEQEVPANVLDATCGYITVPADAS